jgi:hypothetical protein
VIVLVAWAAPQVLANQRREAALANLRSTVTEAPVGSDIDLRSAFDLDWDRAVFIEPYDPGYAANAKLGFKYWADDDTPIDDAQQLLVFAKGRSVVAELRLEGESFWFADATGSIDPASARFRVERQGADIVLRPAG